MTTDKAFVSIEQVAGQPRATTTSLSVAECFERRHDNVIRDIENLNPSSPLKFEEIEPEEFKEMQAFFNAHFSKTFYNDAQSKPRPMYTMDRDGWTLLVMGYQGPKAMIFKIRYIKRFDQMEAILTEQIAAAVELEAKATARRDLLNNLCFDPLRLNENGEPVKEGGTVIDSTIAAFLLECVEQQHGIVTNSTTLYQAYLQWCRNSDNVPVTHARFSRILSVIGVPKGRTATARYYQEITLGSKASSIPWVRIACNPN